MRHHLALKAEDQGSILAANRQFGSVTLWKENSRAMWTGMFWEQFGQDIRYGLRKLIANKFFTAMAAISLALGIGANTAIYSFMDAIMIRALPVQHPEQLAIVNWRAKVEAPVIRDQAGTTYSGQGWARVSPNYPYRAYEFLRDNNPVFSTLFGYADAGRLNLTVDGQAELGQGQYVSGGYFGGLGARPAAGRLIAPADDRPDAAPVVTIAYSFWQHRFAGNTDAVGKSILINGKPFTVVGVSAPEFFGVRPQSAPKVFVPIRDLEIVNLGRFQEADTRFTGDHFYLDRDDGPLETGR